MTRDEKIKTFAAFMASFIDGPNVLITALNKENQLFMDLDTAWLDGVDLAGNPMANIMEANERAIRLFLAALEETPVKIGDISDHANESRLPANHELALNEQILNDAWRQLAEPTVDEIEAAAAAYANRNDNFRSDRWDDLRGGYMDGILYGRADIMKMRAAKGNTTPTTEATPEPPNTLDGPAFVPVSQQMAAGMGKMPGTSMGLDNADL